MTKSIEIKILDEIDTTVPIHQLRCIHSLPNINIEWNVWLVYSALKNGEQRLRLLRQLVNSDMRTPLLHHWGNLM